MPEGPLRTAWKRLEQEPAPPRIPLSKKKLCALSVLGILALLCVVSAIAIQNQSSGVSVALVVGSVGSSIALLALLYHSSQPQRMEKGGIDE